MVPGGVRSTRGRGEHIEYADMDGRRNVDGRGVVRGKCKSEGCLCTSYYGGDSKKLCACGHPPSGPGGHEKLYTSFEADSPMETGDISETGMNKVKSYHTSQPYQKS